MAGAAGVEAFEKIKKTGGIMRNVVFTAKNKAFELVDDTKAEVIDMVDKTKSAAFNVKTSGNSLIQGIKNFGGLFSKSKPSENLVRGLPEAGLPKGQVDFTTGKIQEGARRQKTLRRRGGSRRQNAGYTRKDEMNTNFKKVYLMLDQQEKPEYMSLQDLLEYQKKINSGEIKASTPPDKTVKTNPKKNNSSVIVMPSSEVEVEVDPQTNTFTEMTVKGEKMSIKNALNAYKNYNPKNNSAGNAPAVNTPATNAPAANTSNKSANNGKTHKYVETLKDSNSGDLYYVLPNGDVSWDKPEGDYIVLPENWGVNATGNSIKFKHYNTGKVVSNVPTANTPISKNAPAAAVNAPAVEETPEVSENTNGNTEQPLAAAEEAPAATEEAAAEEEAPAATNAVGKEAGNNKQKSAFNALMNQINSLEAKLKNIKNTTAPASGGRRRRHSTRRRRQTKRRRGSSRHHRNAKASRAHSRRRR